MTCLGHIGEINKKGSHVVEWEIDGFLFLPGSQNDYYRSPKFFVLGEWWYFAVRPNGKQHNESTNVVAVTVVKWNHSPTGTVHLTLGIRTREGLENRRELIHKFDNENYACFCFDFCSRSKLKEDASRLMRDGKLVIWCHIKSDELRDASSQTDGKFSEVEVPAETGESSRKLDASSQTDAEFSEAEVPAEDSESSQKLGCEKAMEDFDKLLTSGEMSDVTVKVGDVEFRVHKNILLARSPALSISLQHESEEKATNRIIIKDCEAAVFRDFLQYLYTGSVGSLTQQNVFGLYRIADRYLADDLKLMTLKHIRVTICEQSFCETVKLALTHGEDDLLRLAIDFAAQNLPTIIRSVEWQNFIKEYPTEANEILVKCIKL